MDYKFKLIHKLNCPYDIKDCNLCSNKLLDNDYSVGSNYLKLLKGK